MKQQAGFRFGQLSMSVMAFLFVSLVLLSAFQQVRGTDAAGISSREGKSSFKIRPRTRGCSRFGHSCFGAHGKRSELPSGLDFGQAGLENTGFGPIPRPVAADYYPVVGASSGRVSPYLLEWLIAAHRADARGSALPQEVSKDELMAAEIQKK